MGMPPNKRHLVLAGLSLASILAAVAVSRDDNGGVIQPISRGQASVQNGFGRAREHTPDKESMVSEEQVDQLAPRRIDGELYPLFPAAPKIIEPLAASAVAEQAPEPTAPPLPFKYLGQMIENGKVTLFLSKNDTNIVAKAGDMIDGIYRLDAIQSGVAEFTYLPLKQKQTLSIGEKS